MKVRKREDGGYLVFKAGSKEPLGTLWYGPDAKAWYYALDPEAKAVYQADGYKGIKEDAQDALIELWRLTKQEGPRTLFGIGVIKLRNDAQATRPYAARIVGYPGVQVREETPFEALRKLTEMMEIRTRPETNLAVERFLLEQYPLKEG